MSNVTVLASHAPIVSVRDLEKTFTLKRRAGAPARSLRAVRAVSFDIAKGETLGLVGESGSGKSTTGRMLVGLIPATAGRIKLFGEELTGKPPRGTVKRMRERVQFVFQDPHGSLDPRMRVGDAIAEPMDIAGGYSRADRQRRIQELLDTVGLPRSCGERFPHEFSGGQRQRIGIARALALKPQFIVCDEPVSALDVSLQAQVVNLLQDLQEAFGLSYLFIAHDLAVVRNISHRVAVMYAGAIVEIAPRDELYGSPQHPYTQALLDAVPRPDPFRRTSSAVRGELPSLLSPPSGCMFHNRCPHATERCRQESPALRPVSLTRQVACHLVGGDAAANKR
ncbi:MAG: ATP-binding cassette domain-containing protein [Variovorax sp.]|nr:ATP-binding cassette domain-containing protein [Variovorax sp.]